MPESFDDTNILPQSNGIVDTIPAMNLKCGTLRAPNLGIDWTKNKFCNYYDDQSVAVEFKWN